MSHTTLAIAYGTSFATFHHYKNGWGSAPFIWDMLVAKYDVKGNTLDMFSGWKNLWKYHEKNTLEPFEHNTLITTYDRYVVKRDDMLMVAKSFERFVEVYPPEGRVCSLLEQAKHIREAHADEAQFLAWNQTSISDEWFTTIDNETDKVRTYDCHVEVDHTVADVIPWGEPA